MSRIGRISRDVHRSLAPQANPYGTDEPRASQPEGQEFHPASRPGSDGLAGQFIQDPAATASVAAGRTRPAPTTASSRRRPIPVLRLLPHTIQLCIHCRQNPAGFWVSRTGSQTVRRPWCLSCCQELDPDRCDVIPFDS